MRNDPANERIAEPVDDAASSGVRVRADAGESEPHGPRWWMAVVEVLPLPGNDLFDSAAAGGGFLTAVARAVDARDFVARVTRHVSGYGVAVDDVTEVRWLEDDWRQQGLDASLVAAIDRLSAPDDVALSDLFTYPLDDAPSEGGAGAA